MRLCDFIDYVRDKGLCAYCGEYAEHIEHVVPRCLDLPTYTVPSCAECNLLAGDTPVVTFAEKRRLIHDLLRERYSNVLSTPDHSAAELEQLGYTLRNLVCRSLEIRDIVRRRLSFRLDEYIISHELEDTESDLIENTAAMENHLSYIVPLAEQMQEDCQESVQEEARELRRLRREHKGRRLARGNYLKPLFGDIAYIKPPA